MKTLQIKLFIVFILLSPFTKAQDLILTLGQVKNIKYSGKSVWIQDRKILSGIPSAGGLTIKALAEGETLIQLGTEMTHVQVLHPMQISLFEQFQKYVAKLPGLKLQMRDGEVLIGGTLYRFKDWQTLADLVKNNPRDYKFQAQMSAEIQNQVEHSMNQLLEKSGMRPQKFIFSDAVELRLPPQHPDLTKIKKILRPFGITISLDSAQIQSEPTIKIRITVAEVQKDQMISWGLQWPESARTQILPKFDGSTDPIDIQLNALESRGQGRVLASPNLICQSGQEAEFLAGGEFPVKFVNYKQREVIWKKYGIFLKVKPKADSSGRMNIKIETEVSNITAIIDGIPSLATNRVSSAFDLKETKTIVLSGLLKEQTNNTQKGLPWLSEIPVLGKLFSSEDYLKKRTELLIFVRPEVVQEDQSEPTETNNTHLVESEPSWNQKF